MSSQELEDLFGDSSDDEDDVKVHVQESTAVHCSTIFVEIMRLKVKLKCNAYSYNLSLKKPNESSAKSIPKEIGIDVSSTDAMDHALKLSLMQSFETAKLEKQVTVLESSKEQGHLDYDMSTIESAEGKEYKFDILIALGPLRIDRVHRYDICLVPGGSLVTLIRLHPCSEGTLHPCCEGTTDHVALVASKFPTTHWVIEDALIKPLDKDRLLVVIRKRAVHCNTGGAIYWFDEEGTPGKATQGTGTGSSYGDRIAAERRLLEQVSVPLSIHESRLGAPLIIFLPDYS